MLSFKEYEILSSTTMQVFSYININLLIFFMPNLKLISLDNGKFWSGLIE